MNNIVFLDIDGVLNKGRDNTKSDRFRYDDKWSHPEDEFDLYYINPELVQRFVKMVEDFDLKIVISSTWRYDETLDSLKEMLGNRFLPTERIIGVTPEFEGFPRKDEIRYYILHSEIPIDKYIIIDDDPNANYNSKQGKYFQTSFEKGYTEKIDKKVREYLNKE